MLIRVASHDVSFHLNRVCNNPFDTMVAQGVFLPAQCGSTALAGGPRRTSGSRKTNSSRLWLAASDPNRPNWVVVQMRCVAAAYGADALWAGQAPRRQEFCALNLQG